MAAPVQASRKTTAEIKAWSSHEKLFYLEAHMSTQFPESWTLVPSMRLCSRAFAPNVRETIFSRLSHLCQNFRTELEKQMTIYEIKKRALSSNSLGAGLDARAFNKMGEMFSTLRPTFDPIVSQIDRCRTVALTHFQQFKEAKIDEKVVPEIDRLQEELTQLQIRMGTLLVETDDKIRKLTERGKAIGPSFAADPAIFLLGTPLHALPNSEISNKPVGEAIEIIEAIKQERSVQQALQPYYVLCMNGIRAISKMEKGLRNLVAAHLNQDTARV